MRNRNYRRAKTARYQNRQAAIYACYYGRKAAFERKAKWKKESALGCTCEMCVNVRRSCVSSGSGRLTMQEKRSNDQFYYQLKELEVFGYHMIEEFNYDNYCT
jgi:hypothetical protein